MPGCVFYILFAGIILVDVMYVAWFVYGAIEHDMRWISLESTKMYTEVAMAVIVSAGIATSVLASALSAPIPRHLIRPAILYLTISIVVSVMLMMILTRATETAIGRALRQRLERNEPTDPHLPLQGKLNWVEFSLAMVCASVSLGAFMLGFLYLGRLGYVLDIPIGR